VGAHHAYSRPSCTVVVLSAGASPHLKSVLDAITASVPTPEEVVLIWSGVGPAVSKLPSNVTVRHLDVGTFNHGHTRQLALESCTTELIAFVSDDAVPATLEWLDTLTAPFSRASVGAVFGRQKARDDAPLSERVYRTVRYPERSVRIGLESFRTVDRLTLPISDANAAYRAAALRTVGGFPDPCTYGEDQICAAKLVQSGWEVVYAPEAVVWHSHALGWRDVFRRARQAGALSRGDRAKAQHRSPFSFGTSRTFVRLLQQGWRQGRGHGVGSVMLYGGLRAAGYVIGRLLG
jgi:cellulose synthase/poly-beta-1,6-N-acetylglucosamine synthase-like glycosyltransferase